MPRASRYFPGGIRYHVLNRGDGRSGAFRDDGAFSPSRRSSKRRCESAGCESALFGFCLNHGTLSSGPTNGDLPDFMQQMTNTPSNAGRNIGTRSGMAICIRAVTSVSRGNRGLLLPSRPLYRGTRCATNLVAFAEDWRWSSLRRAERDDPAFPILSDWPLPRPADWLEIVNQAGDGSRTRRSGSAHHSAAADRWAAQSTGPPRSRSNSRSSEH